MTIFARSMLGLLLTAAVICVFGAQRVAALTPGGELASHRAIYELKLAHTRGNSPAVAARGRILYDFSGNSCDGYALQFRQVSELDNGEGKVTLSDLRSTTWEDGAAKKFIFKSQNYVNETLIDTVDGQAERQECQRADHAPAAGGANGRARPTRKSDAASMRTDPPAVRR